MTRRVGVVSPAGRVSTGPPAVHLPAETGRTVCGLDITLDWDTRLIDHPRQTCRACQPHTTAKET